MAIALGTPLVVPSAAAAPCRAPWHSQNQLIKYVYHEQQRCSLHCCSHKAQAAFRGRHFSPEGETENDESDSNDNEELSDDEFEEDNETAYQSHEEAASNEASQDADEEENSEFNLPLVTGERGPYPGPSRVETRRRRAGAWNEPAHRLLILKPPMSDLRIAERLLSSPQLKLNALPLLSSCLPGAPFRDSEREWFQEHMLEIKDALGYADLHEETPDGGDCWKHESLNPADHLGTLLYLAFQHEESARAKRARHTRVSHLRLAFLGEFVLDLALCELLLQVYPKETPACLRERAFAITNKRGFENILRDACLYDLAFPDYLEILRFKKDRRLILHKDVFLGIVAAVYLSLGMAEVYRLLFETFGFDLDAKEAQPRERFHRGDVDHVSADFKAPLTWEDIAFYKPPADAIFATPRLFRACVPPGMYRFHKNVWDTTCLPRVMEVLGYPLFVHGDTSEIVDARNRELGLGLQLCFMHPSLYKSEHPRFCNERLEYLGSKIQDLVAAERLLMKKLDAPDRVLQVEHRLLMMNRICGRRLRIKRLHKMILYSEERQVKFDKVRRLRNFTTNAVEQAIHGIGYVVYGKAEVRRLMFDVFEVGQPLPLHTDFIDSLAFQRRKFANTLRPTY